MRLHKAAQTVYRTQAHLVWVPRSRRTVLVPGVQRARHVKLLEVCNWRPEWEFMAIGMEVDPVHLHRGIPPQYAVSQAVETLKANTSRALTAQCALLHTVYWDGDGMWSTGYCVSTVGIDEAIIRRYVEMQGQEDTGQAQLEWF